MTSDTVATPGRQAGDSGVVHGSEQPTGRARRDEELSAGVSDRASAEFLVADQDVEQAGRGVDAVLRTQGAPAGRGSMPYSPELVRPQLRSHNRRIPREPSPTPGFSAGDGGARPPQAAVTPPTVPLRNAATGHHGRVT
jgi:hypothetical protein